ncbi:hypothetical protein E1B28_006796 [Marasmius oreades]|uniref:Uncharacterized protein n=1 Tax=Marasmius oreades TaxID=181124 RepID=A0A9P7UWU8_9AGAR|nr:uncharacterized protein E1B28_006796 [Marasmius oreades]KAG7096122.1 hypothetical protein E1B28_006796 [Marasmius oreades]
MTLKDQIAEEALSEGLVALKAESEEIKQRLLECEAYISEDISSISDPIEATSKSPYIVINAKNCGFIVRAMLHGKEIGSRLTSNVEFLQEKVSSDPEILIGILSELEKHTNNHPWSGGKPSYPNIDQWSQLQEGIFSMQQRCP